MKHFVRHTRQFHEYQIWYDPKTNQVIEGFGGWINMHTFMVRLRGEIFTLTKHWEHNQPYTFLGYL